MKVDMNAWTLVQHSGFGYGQDPAWQNGVETRELNNESIKLWSADVLKVINAKGVIFFSYKEATESEEFINGITDPDAGGLYPRATGEFSDSKIDDLAIYIPATIIAR